MIPDGHPRLRIAPLLIACLFVYGAVGALVRESALAFFPVMLFSESRWILALILVAVWTILTRGRLLPSLAEWSVAAVLGLVLYLSSDLFFRPGGFFVGGWSRFDLLGLGLIGASGVALVRTSTARRFGAVAVLLAAMTFLSSEFLSTANGRMLFSDDHPSFLYRLQLLVQEFPAIPFYNTDWNAGLLAREFFASGILNVFLLSSPLLFSGWFGDLLAVESAAGLYSAILVYCFFLLAPVSIWTAARLLGAGIEAASLSALVFLGFSISFLEWLFRYGTLGFCLSVVLFPLAAALVVRLFHDRPTPRLFVFALVVTSLCLMWTLGIVGFVPIGLLALVNRERSIKTRMFVVGGFALAFLLLNGGWLATFVRESKVTSFVAGSELPGTHSIPKVSGGEETIVAELLDGVRRAREFAVRTNPLVLIFGFVGIFCVDRRYRASLLGSVVLLLLAAIASELKPQLELKRLTLFAVALLATLTGVGVVAVVAELRRLMPRLAPAACVLIFGFVLASPANLAAMLRNRSDVRLSFSPVELKTMSEALAGLRDNGRTVVLGFILHELGSTNVSAQDGGHIAPVATFSGHELYASHFYHARWSSVDPIPKSYRARGEEGIEEFLDLVNATSVITHSRPWSEYCSRGSQYELLWQGGRFKLWSRKTEATAFLYGAGSVERVGRRELIVRPQTAESVIKYRYHPRLRVLDAQTKEGGIDSSQLAQISILPVFAFDEELGGKKVERVDYIQIHLPESLVGRSLELRLGDR